MGDYAKDPAAVTRQTAASPLPAAALAAALAAAVATSDVATSGACGGRRGTMVALIARRLVTRPLPPHL